MLDNPIFRYELTRLARWRTHYIIRFAMGLALLAVVGLFHAFWTHELAMGHDFPLHRLRYAPGVIFVHLAWTQGLLIVALVPGWVAGTIAEEDRRGTMLYLLASPLPSRAIVLGKLAAKMVRVGFILATGVPLVLPAWLLGIIDLKVIVAVYVIQIALAGLIASLALLVSTLIRRPREAILFTYLLVGGWLFLPQWLDPMLRALPWPLSWLATINEGLLLANPSQAGWSLWWMAISLFYGMPARGTWIASGLDMTLPPMVLTELAVSSVFVLSAIFLLRPVRLGLRNRGRAQRVEHEPRQTKRPIGDDPMRWKERYTSGRFSRPVAWVAALLLGTLIVGTLVGPASSALREQWALMLGLEPRTWGGRDQLNEVLRHLSVLVYLVGLAAVAASASARVTGEKDQGTWISLTTTPLTGLEVARAKVLGTLWEMRGVMSILFGFWSLGLIAGAIHPLGAIAAALGVVAFWWYASALGVLCSMVTRDSERAFILTLAILFFTNSAGLLFVPLELIGSLGGSPAAIFMAGVTPFVEWFSLASPVEVHQAIAGDPWDQRMQLPFNLWSIRLQIDNGLIRTYLASLTLHALAALAATRLAALAYEFSRDAAPSPRVLLNALRRQFKLKAGARTA